MNDYKLLEISSFIRNIKTECTVLEFHEDFLIAGSHGGLLSCWDTITGLEKWSNDFEGPCSEIIIEQGLIYLAEEGNIHCINLESGESLWSNQIDGLSEFIKIYDESIWVGSAVYDLQISNYSESGIWEFNKNGTFIKKIELNSKPWFFDVTDFGIFIGLSRPLCGYGKINTEREIEYYNLVNKNPVTTGICHENIIFLGHSDGNVSIIGDKIEERKNTKNMPVKCFEYHKGVVIGLESGNIYSENGWEIDDSVILARKLEEHGVDVVDCSAGGISGAPLFRVNNSGKPMKTNMDRGPGFQVPYADKVKNEAGIKTMAVGVIVDPNQAEEILQSDKADLIAVGRELMYNPFWALHAAQALNADPEFAMWPEQYKWGVNRRGKLAEFKGIRDEVIDEKKLDSHLSEIHKQK